MHTSTEALLPAITVHGRFQPPLHVNHWEYIQSGFDRAEHVSVLITNPYNDEAFDQAASWRNDPANNPFTFDERRFMFDAFFQAAGIAKNRYTITPFNIKDPASFRELDPAVPNLVNVYSEWSKKKVDLFRDQGLSVVRLDMPKSLPVSGTAIREIIRSHQGSESELRTRLADAGFIPDALPGLVTVLRRRKMV